MSLLKALSMGALFFATTGAFGMMTMTFDRGDVKDNLDKQAFWTIPGHPINIKMNCKDANPEKSKAVFKWRIVNESGEVMKEGSFEKEFGKECSHGFPIAIDRHGVYRLEVACDKNKEKSKAETLFAVFPPLNGKNVKDGILGAALNRKIGETEMLPYLGLTCNRRWCAMGETGARKRYFTASGNEFTDKYFNEQFNPATRIEKEANLEPLANFCNASGRPVPINGTSEEWNAYKKWWINNYLLPLLKAGKGHIKYWEIENEPYYSYRDRPDRYVDLLKESYNAIKKFDPSVQVVGPSGPPDELGEKFWHDIFSKGALKYIDIVSFHKYCPVNKLIMSPDVRFVKWFRRLKEITAQYGGGDKPLWNTETSVSPPATMYALEENLKNVRYRSGAKSPNPREQAAVAARVLAVHYAYNIKYNFHMYTLGRTYDCHTFEFDGTPLALAVAYAWMSRALESEESLGNMSRTKRINWYAFKNKKTGKPITIGWIEQLYPNDKSVIELPSELCKNTVYDIFGNITGRDVSILNFTAEPTYVGFDLPANKAISVLKKIKLSISKEKTAKSSSEKNCEPASPSDWVGYYSVDLKPYVNRSFSDKKAMDKKGGFTDEGDNDLRFMPTGNILVNNVPFKIINPDRNDGKSCLVMGSGIRDYFPKRIFIKIPDGGKRFTNLHFLQLATNVSLKNKSELGKYIIHYADGYKEEIPLKANRNVLDWWNIGKNSVAKKGLIVPNLYKDNGICVRHLEWTQSHPRGYMAKTTGIELIMNKKTRPIFVLLAITGSLSN